MTTPAEAAAIAFKAIQAGKQIQSFGGAGLAFSKAERQQAVCALRALWPAKAVGRKLGFTNRGIWSQFGVDAPIVGDLFENTVVSIADLDDGLSLTGLCEPRIEPEIVFGFGKAPDPADLSDAAIMDCIQWVAPSFEIVQSIYPGWKFTLTDCAAGGVLHGRLALGPKISASEIDLSRLARLEVSLFKDDVLVESGGGFNVLDGPISAIRHLVEELRDDAFNAPLAANEIVTTGSMTGVPPIAPGEVWRATFEDSVLPTISTPFS